MIELEPNDLQDMKDTLNDVLIEMGLDPDKYLDRATNIVLNKVPNHIVATAVEWGWNDTVVGDDLVEFMRSHRRELITPSTD